MARARQGEAGRPKRRAGATAGTGEGRQAKAGGPKKRRAGATAGAGEGARAEAGGPKKRRAGAATEADEDQPAEASGPKKRRAGAANGGDEVRRAKAGDRVVRVGSERGRGATAGARAAAGSRARGGEDRDAGSGRPRPGADERRAALLAAAYATIADLGLEGLRTREVAARAGVNIATLHYHFGSKEDLVVAVIAHVRERFVAAGARAGGDGVAAHLAAAGELFRDDPQLGRVMLELVLRGQRDRAARTAFRSLHDFWAGMIEALLRDGVARGELRQDLDARAGGRVVTSFVMGAMIQLGVNARAFEFAAVAEELGRWLTAPPRRAR
ncbi:TetR family transcriptional regulator [Nannocystis pusilla]|uniref:TetR/AcrR family transcriptional regulator n=1 Tax=Nannocystis pusilla TaxID=889268 RepID=UPI003DA67FAB